MWDGKIIKIIPAVVFLFCLLEIFELFLVIEDMDKTEKLETEIRNNLKALEDITVLLNKHSKSMDSKQNKKIKIE